MSDLNRRYFLAASSSLALGLSARAAEPASNKIVAAVLGTGGRGLDHCRSFSKQPGVEIAYVCDVDKNRVNNAAKIVTKSDAKTPQVATDFRKVLDDKAVDAVIVASCNHWHAPMAIMACAAGKHVYVEKPCCHNPHEGELMVEAARKHKRLVQMGNQGRSMSHVNEAIEQLRGGVIGRVYFAQAFYVNNRPSIGKGKPAPAPEDLDYDLWQGPAPRRPFRSNYLHYNWHWFWHWGNGELGNNGIHTLDHCRWGLGVEFPTQVTSLGGRYKWQDDQETPDTNVVSWGFDGGKAISWEGLSCSCFPNGQPANVIFHGEKGILALHNNHYAIHDSTKPRELGKEIKKVPGKGGDQAHIANFLSAIRGEAKLNSPIDEGHKSTLLCHLGNIAYRTGRVIRCDPKNGHIVGDKEAAALWSREYEKGWEPKV